MKVMDILDNDIYIVEETDKGKVAHVLFHYYDNNDEDGLKENGYCGLFIRPNTSREDIDNSIETSKQYVASVDDEVINEFLKAQSPKKLSLTEFNEDTPCGCYIDYIYKIS